MCVNHDDTYSKAREKFEETIKEAIQEFSEAIGDPPSVVMGATLVWETSMYDDDGCQVYSMKHVVLAPSSLVYAVGLLSAARDRLSNYVSLPVDD